MTWILQAEPSDVSGSIYGHIYPGRAPTNLCLD